MSSPLDFLPLLLSVDYKESRKTPSPGHFHGPEAGISRRRRRKVSKEDKTQVELQRPPTQECILVLKGEQVSRIELIELVTAI